MHNVFISLPHSLPSITNTSISAYKVTVVDLDKAFNSKTTNSNKASINH